MARRITRPSMPTTAGNTRKPITVKNTSVKDFFMSAWDIINSQQFRLVAAIVLIFTALILLIAYVSFFFTGANDASIIELTFLAFSPFTTHSGSILKS